MSDTIYTVSEITGQIRKTLENRFVAVSVQGEISNYIHHSSGHRYFSIKDEGAQIQCVLWRSRFVNLQITEGMKVVVNGNITVYPQRGAYQLDCTSIRPLGQGDLFVAFELLKRKLAEKGYFDSEHKKQIPRMPLIVGIATSPTGAALQDMKTTISRRFPLCEIILRPTLCQGDGSAEDIAAAIYDFQKSNVDVLIIGRGGGSIEDLWSFNTEVVADAIYNSQIPVISAVGHETDFTISDFVADIRAATPTAAAEIVTPITQQSFNEFLENSLDNMTNILKHKLEESRSIIDRFLSSYGIRRFEDKVRNYQQYLDDIEMRMDNITRRQIRRLSVRLNAAVAHIHSLNPKNPLYKGYALLKNAHGLYLGADKTVLQGDVVIVERKADELITEVKQIKDKNYEKED